MKHSPFYHAIPNELSLKKFLPQEEIISSWAAVNLLFCENEGEVFIAMIKRAINEQDPWSGHYAFPGGKLEGSESLLQAANRETYEEIGLQLKDNSHVQEFLRFQVRYQKKVYPFAVAAFAQKLSTRPKHFRIDESEVAEAFWLPLRAFFNAKNVKWKSLAKQNNELYPCVQFDGHTIWGLSYFILWELFDQLSELCDHSHLPPFSYHQVDNKK